MAALSENFSVDSFVEEARRFTKATGLAGDEVRRVMEAESLASMAMLGQTAYVLTRTAKEGIEKLKPFSERILCSRVARSGARVLSD